MDEPFRRGYREHRDLVSRMLIGMVTPPQQNAADINAMR
jgi:hypothetical protein